MQNPITLKYIKEPTLYMTTGSTKYPRESANLETRRDLPHPLGPIMQISNTP